MSEETAKQETIRLKNDDQPLSEDQYCLLFISLAQVLIDNFDGISHETTLKPVKKGQTSMLKHYGHAFRDELIKYEKKVVEAMGGATTAIVEANQMVALSMEIEDMLKAYIKHITNAKSE